MLLLLNLQFNTKCFFLFLLTKHYVMTYWIYFWFMESAGDIWKLTVYITKTFKALLAITPFCWYFPPASCWRASCVVWSETKSERRVWPTWNIWRMYFCSSSSCDLAVRGRPCCQSFTQCCSSVQRRKVN